MPVKILSFHLLVLATLVLVPQARRLANVLVLERAGEPAVQPQLFESSRANRIAATVQVALGVWIVIGIAAGAWQAWNEWGGGRPTSEYYGIWTVTDQRVDGVSLPPLTSDPQRLHRVVFDDPGAAAYQLMDGTIVPSQVDGDTLITESGTFTIERPEPGRLVLTSESTVVETTLTDLDDFVLRSRGFHWGQDYPFAG